MKRWLGTIAVGLFMLGTGCGEVGGEPSPDGSSSDNGPADVIPNDCSTDMPEVFPLNGSNQTTLGWMWNGLDRANRDDLDFVATFRGVATLDTPAIMSCPQHMDSARFYCETKQALKLERSVEGTTETYYLSVPVAPSDIALPAEGTRLRVFDDHASLQLKVESSSRLLLHIGRVVDPHGGDVDAHETTYVEQLGPLQIEMKADYSNPASATCVTYFYCPGIHRMEPLTFSGDSTVTVEMGSSGEVSAEGGSFKVWNLFAQRKNNDYVSEPTVLEEGVGWCAYARPPTAYVAIVRQNP
jgi:hypothetical protein